MGEKISGRYFNLLVQFFDGLFGIWDTQCGFKCFTSKAVENIFPKMRMNGFAFDVEALVLAKKHDYKIKEIPIVWKNDLESKVKLKNVFNMFLDILRVRKNLILGKYVSKK